MKREKERKKERGKKTERERERNVWICKTSNCKKIYASY